MYFYGVIVTLLFFMTDTYDLQCGQGKVINKYRYCIQPQYIQGCMKYQTESKCQECEQGYKIGKLGCDALELLGRKQKLLGCLVRSDQQYSKCLNCAKGYIRINDECKTGIQNCLQYDTQYNCLRCQRGYSLILNECRHNKIIGCNKQNKDFTCQQCFKPFHLKQFQCYVQNCKTLNDYGCVTCLCGYYLTVERTCKKIQQGCLRYERGRCINCVSHYKLKGSICQIQGCIQYKGDSCILCQQQYEFYDGWCMFKNCVDWIHGQCIACKQGYQLSSTGCVKHKSGQCQ